MPEIDSRLQEILRLPNGWKDGEGISFDTRNLAMAGKLLNSLCEGFDLPAPYIYPAIGNELNCEWTFGSNREIEASLKFDFNHSTILFTWNNLCSDDSFEQAFSVENDSITAIQTIGRLLSRINHPGAA